MGAFSGAARSVLYESDGCHHYYLYTALGFQVVAPLLFSQQNQITFYVKSGKISQEDRPGLDNFVIDSATQKYKYFETVPIKTGNSVIPLDIDPGSTSDVNISHVGLFTVTPTLDGSNKVTFSYSCLSATLPIV
ncbi:MAG: hypothetical protein ACLVJH_18980 [Faecalibacterium prausnitzii]